MTEYFKSLVYDAIKLWRTYGENYRTAVTRYHELLAQAKRIGVPSDYIHPLKKGIFKQYPRVPVLNIENYDELWKYLNDCTAKSLRKIIADIEELPLNYYYNTVSSAVCDLRYLISRHEQGWKNTNGIFSRTPIKVSCGKMTHSGMLNQPKY